MKRALALTMLLLIVLFGLAAYAPVTAHSPAQATQEAYTCDSVVPLVTEKLGPACNDMTKDQLCYGNQTVAVEYRDPAEAAQNPFKQVGNVIPLNLVKSITTGRLNLNASEWGIAVMKTQADVAGATAGQAVTFVLYGDTSFQNLTPGAASTTSSSTTTTAPACTATTNRVTILRAKAGAQEAQVQRLTANTQVNVLGRIAGGDWVKVDVNGTTGWVNPGSLKSSCDVNSLPLASDDPSAQLPPSTGGVNAFYFSSGVGSQATCRNVPASGLVVSNPKGQTVQMNINGADVTISSVLIIQAQPNGQMLMTWIEGGGTVAVCNKIIDVQAGETVSLFLGGFNGLNAHAICSNLVITNLGPNNLNIDQLCKLVPALGALFPCNVTPDCTKLKIDNFLAAPNPLRMTYNRSGFPVCAPGVLRWHVSAAENVTLNGRKVSRMGAQNICIGAETTYNLQATCGDQSASQGLTLSVQR